MSYIHKNKEQTLHVPRSPSTVKCIVDGLLGKRLGVNGDRISSVPHAIQRPLDDPISADFNNDLLPFNDLTSFTRRRVALGAELILDVAVDGRDSPQLLCWDNSR